MRGNHRSSRHTHWQSDKSRVGAGKMERMKAVRIHNYGGPEVLQYEDAPPPQLGNGEVLNMAVFNFEPEWNRIFNLVPARENIWC